MKYKLSSIVKKLIHAKNRKRAHSNMSLQLLKAE